MSYEEQYKQAKSEGNLVSLTPKYIDFSKKGDVLIGKYLSRSPVKSSLSEGNYYQYLFDTDFGLVKFHLGRSMDNEAGQLFRLDGVYRVEFQGKEKISGARSVNKFQIDQISKGREEDIAL